MPAYIGAMSLSLYIPMALSLKDKRKQVKSLKERLAARFNISIAETDFLDDWQRSELSLVLVSNDRRYIEKQAALIESLVIEVRDVELLAFNFEWR